MQDDLSNSLSPQPDEPIDPIAMARRDQRKALPKRFYKEAAARDENGTDHFTATVNDGTTTTSHTFTITITPVNDAPKLQVPTLLTHEDKSIGGSAHATDVDHDVEVVGWGQEEGPGGLK